MEDLRKLGYDVETVVVPACAVSARHRRNRVWICANRKKLDCNGSGRANNKSKGKIRQSFGRMGVFCNASIERLPDGTNGTMGEPGTEQESERSDWWAVEPNVGRVAHGIPQRVDRLKGLGNAIVPQVAYQIMKAIKEIEYNGTV